MVQGPSLDRRSLIETVRLARTLLSDPPGVCLGYFRSFFSAFWRHKTAVLGPGCVVLGACCVIPNLVEAQIPSGEARLTVPQREIPHEPTQVSLQSGCRPRWHPECGGRGPRGPRGRHQEQLRMTQLIKPRKGT